MILLVYWALISLFLVLQLQRLSDAGEESVIVTANISDDTTSVLGIDELFLVLQLQRLSDVGEESVIVTANISDDTTSIRGIDKFISCFTATETI